MIAPRLTHADNGLTPRIHAMARLAVCRLAAGHDPLEVITDALARAIGAPEGLPASWDNLSPTQRDVLLVVHGSGAVRVAAIARALRIDRHAALHRCQRLEAAQILRRVGWGTYEINVAAPTVKNRPGSRAVYVPVLAALREHGPLTVTELASACGIPVSTMHCRIRRMLGDRLVTNPKHRVYALPADATT